MRRLSRALAGAIVAALGASTLGLLGAGPSSARTPATPTAAVAAGTAGPLAAFIGNNQSLYTYGSSTGAVALGGAVAPAGAPLATTRDAVNGPSVFFIGLDGAMYYACPYLLRPARITAAVAPPGTRLAATTTAGEPTAAWFSGMELMLLYEISHPCTGGQTLAAPNPAPMMPVLWQPAGGIAAAGFADGGLAVLATATDGSVHELSSSLSGAWKDAVIAPAGSATAYGIAATALPSATGRDVLELFYANSRGQVWKTRLTLGSGGTQPDPHPWTSDNAVPLNAPLAAAYGPLGTYVSYADAAGRVRVLSADAAADTWQKTDMVSAPQAAPAGSSTALGIASDEIDVYCGNGIHIPGHIRFDFGTTGPGAWLPAGTQALLTAGTVIAAT